VTLAFPAGFKGMDKEAVVTAVGKIVEDFV
jgi:hypothetical protein